MRYGRAALLTALGLGVATGAAVLVSRARDVDQRSTEPVASSSEFEPAAAPVIAVLPEPTKKPAVSPVPPKTKKDGVGEKNATDQALDKAAFVRKFDADGDGELSKEEWVVAKQSSPQEQKDSRLQALMSVLNDRYDTDRDGRLSPEEREVLNREFGAAKRQIASDITPRYDLDGDGRLTGEEKVAAGPDFRAPSSGLRRSPCSITTDRGTSTRPSWPWRSWP